MITLQSSTYPIHIAADFIIHLDDVVVLERDICTAHILLLRDTNIITETEFTKFLQRRSENIHRSFFFLAADR